ncbi:heterokaryon incompatibility [Penicillium odoratum]|uniref:heterokaryon incompatibility n=1 Tax=Penicillium odoratum TaxID=1167516 RepID=UPI0025470BE3|nr:heterokaryon incompatibility [Penicillium odoratum]KAJ5765629.1 heterokaryon incompatibility [Penicillium odoratum]
MDEQLINKEVVKRRREFGTKEFETKREPITFQTIKRIGEFVDWDIISDWLSSCSEEHPKCGPRDLGVKPAHFRLIDVRRRRIVSAPYDCRYVALSYVWGLNTDRSKMSTRATLESLRKDGGLLVSNVVKTINDAITICSHYGWINDQAEQIASMSAIYSSAALVIISTDGDMNDGIHGVSSDRAQKQIQCELAGMKFINELPSWREIINCSSIWSTRCWTYQEGILGRRKIYFSSSQSFFECDKSILDEDGMKQDAMYSPNGLNPQRWHSVIDAFYGHMAKYSRRHLGSEFDIYNAVEGIDSALYASKHPLWFGLPRVDFDKALLWCHDSPSNGEFKGAVKSPPEGLIPSWSWSSTTQSVLLLDDCNRRSIRYCGPLVMWTSCQKTETGCKVEEIVPSSAVDFQCPHCESDVTGNDRDRRYTDEHCYI